MMKFLIAVGPLAKYSVSQLFCTELGIKRKLRDDIEGRLGFYRQWNSDFTLCLTQHTLKDQNFERCAHEPDHRRDRTDTGPPNFYILFCKVAEPPSEQQLKTFNEWFKASVASNLN